MSVRNACSLRPVRHRVRDERAAVLVDPQRPPQGRCGALGAVEALADTAAHADGGGRGGAVEVEAVVENADAKTEIFAALDKIVEDPGAILATNTSSLPIMRLGMATGRADRVVGLHFFNPVPVLPLVEIVASLHTAPGTVEAVEDFATRVLGKTVVHARDRAGFVVNALLIPYVPAAVRMAESGFATATAIDIDAGMELGWAHPMGPLKPAGLIGLDPSPRSRNPSTTSSGNPCTLRPAAPTDGRGRAVGP
ncbi:3-hydroxybutyryl-CoA dehydrogenase [Streptomyces umbrinus]|uniref:3-hydroxybutyryl-CoA dehydrogenase n=1 Tax=Streptomyces umbrinus TaxID=67370 RepID=A0ABU0SNR5_9ACTN|nr:3-hydroxybutyryl-CoA dehydrogenase [Streptomyces umbrinus]